MIKSGRQVIKSLPTIKELKTSLEHQRKVNDITENWFYTVYTLYGIYCYNS